MSHTRDNMWADCMHSKECTAPLAWSKTFIYKMSTKLVFRLGS